MQEFNSDLKERILDNFKELWEKDSENSKAFSKLNSEISVHIAEGNIYKESQKEKIESLSTKYDKLAAQMVSNQKEINLEIEKIKKDIDKLLPNAFRSIITILSIIVGFILSLIALSKYFTIRGGN